MTEEQRIVKRRQDAARAAARRAADPEKARAKAREWSKSHPEAKAAQRRKWLAANPEKSRDQKLRSSYGMTAMDYDAMLAAQGGRCANPGCRTDAPRGMGRFHVDHDHRTGKIRGLLCNGCNLALGHLGDGCNNDRIFGLHAYAMSHEPKVEE
jgi:hypothetical protein